MAWKAQTYDKRLQRIIMLLLSLAGLADRAGGAPFPVRVSYCRSCAMPKASRGSSSPAHPRRHKTMAKRPFSNRTARPRLSA